LLLDTQIVIWLLDDADHLGPNARRSIGAADTVFVSAATSWEVAIKRSVGKLSAPDRFVALVQESGLTWCPITPEVAWSVGDVMLPHRDPFDRLLIAQARNDGLPFMTADQVLLGADVRDVRMLDARA